MQKAIVDKLMDFCELHAEQIAEQWYKALSTNPRTVTCRKLSREGCLRHAMYIYQNIEQMFFADDCYKAVEHVLDVGGFVEDFYARGIPLEELVYTLILLRRHIWLYADSQALFNLDVSDMYNAVNSTTRILLVFDYATYIAARKYRELAARAGR
jgi:hypothetical protein